MWIKWNGSYTKKKRSPCLYIKPSIPRHIKYIKCMKIIFAKLHFSQCEKECNFIETSWKVLLDYIFLAITTEMIYRILFNKQLLDSLMCLEQAVNTRRCLPPPKPHTDMQALQWDGVTCPLEWFMELRPWTLLRRIKLLSI